MTGRRAVIGLCMLCAMAFSAVAAQGAAAAGTTGKTCVGVISHAGETLGYPNDDCSGTPTTNGSIVKSEWAEYSNGTPTKLGVRGRTLWEKIKAVVGGVTLQIQANKATGGGTISNSESGGEMRASGTGTITFEEVSVSAPAGKGCEVEGGKFVTNELKVTTAEQGMAIKFEPLSGSLITTFKVKNCSISPLNKEYKLEGSVKGSPEATVIQFTHAGTTEQGTLTLAGQKAGLEGGLGFEGKDEAAEDTLSKPLGFSTE